MRIPTGSKSASVESFSKSSSAAMAKKRGAKDLKRRKAAESSDAYRAPGVKSDDPAATMRVFDQALMQQFVNTTTADERFMACLFIVSGLLACLRVGNTT